MTIDEFEALNYGDTIYNCYGWEFKFVREHRDQDLCVLKHSGLESSISTQSLLAAFSVTPPAANVAPITLPDPLDPRPLARPAASVSACHEELRPIDFGNYKGHEGAARDAVEELKLQIKRTERAWPRCKACTSELDIEPYWLSPQFSLDKSAPEPGWYVRLKCGGRPC